MLQAGVPRVKSRYASLRRRRRTTHIALKPPSVAIVLQNAVGSGTDGGAPSNALSTVTSFRLTACEGLVPPSNFHFGGFRSTVLEVAENVIVTCMTPIGAAVPFAELSTFSGDELSLEISAHNAT
jgi:hypothetical protein